MGSSQVATTLLSFEQKIRDLRETQAAVNRTIKRVTAAYERSLLNQQQLSEANYSIDQLLTKLNYNNHPSVSSTTLNRVEEPVAASLEPLLVEQLRQQLEQRSELLRRSAHDLKTNFSIISFASHLLHSSPTHEEQQVALNMLHHNVQQASQLINELLDVTRLESGQELRQLTHFNAAELLGGLVETLQPLARQRELWLRSQGPNQLLVEGDSVKLQRIVQNLLLNAINYTQQGGVTLEWASEPVSTQWRLSVTDTGPGLLTGNKQTAGEGIGLLIVQQLCALLDGQLKVESSFEAGSRFIVRLPQQYSTR